MGPFEKMQNFHNDRHTLRIFITNIDLFGVIVAVYLCQWRIYRNKIGARG